MTAEHRFSNPPGPVGTAGDQSANDNHTSALKPNEDTVLDFLTAMFGEATEGLVEICWTDPYGQLRHAQQFELNELEEAAALACEKNTQPGVNTYYGIARRKPGIPKNKRASDADVLALDRGYIDLDDRDAPAHAKETYTKLRCSPSWVVITGKNPSLRAQLLWELEEPITDFARSRGVLSAMARDLKGDPTVVNPSRVLRLPGTIAWPVKAGRVAELTELKPLDGGRPISIEELERAFPPATVTELPAEKPIERTAADPLGLGTHDRLSVEGICTEITNGGQWHTNVVKLVAHWVNSGWTDFEIKLACTPLTMPGYTVAQTAHEVQAAIDSARQKWLLPNPEAKAVDLPAAPTQLTAACPIPYREALLPKRQWVFGTTAIAGAVTVIVAPPGVGKSTYTLEMAVAVATGRRDILNTDVGMGGAVWVYNNEDDLTEMLRRLSAITKTFEVSQEELAGRVFLNSGEERPLLIARRGDNDVVEPVDVEAVIREIEEKGIRLLIIDPFLETHECNENSNEEMNRVTRMYRDIAQRTGCAVVLVHHTGKPLGSDPEPYYGNLNAARGASSLMGVARIAKTLFGMSKADAKLLKVDEERRHLYIRLDDAKANMALVSGQATWFERKGVTIGNGDEVGVLVPWDAPQLVKEISKHTAEQVLNVMREAWDANQPYTTIRGIKPLTTHLVERYDMLPDAAKSYVKAWERNRVIRNEVYDKHTKAKGYRVVISSLDAVA